MNFGERQRLKYAILVPSSFCRFKMNFQVRTHSCALQIHAERHPSSKENNCRKQFHRASFVEQRGWVVFLSHTNCCMAVVDLPFNGRFGFGHGAVSFSTNLFNTEHMTIRRRTLTTITQQQHNILISRFNKIYRITVE